jgi:hypothetical protein
MKYIQNHPEEIIMFCIKLFGFFLFSLLLVAPNLFIQFGKVIDAIKFEARSTHLGADNLGWFGNMFFYVKSYFSFVNLIGILLIFFGVFSLFKCKDIKSLILFYGVFYWIIISILALHWERWALPMYISPNLLIAIGITNLIDFSKRKGKLKYVLILFVFIFFAYQFLYSLSSSINFSFTDTREIALEYCGENDITSEKSVYEGYTPFNPQFPNTIFDYEDVSNDEIKYIILSSQMYLRYLDEPNRYYEEVKFYRHIEKYHSLIYEISPTHVDSKNVKQAIENIGYYIKLRSGTKSEIRLRGPTILIYEIME